MKPEKKFHEDDFQKGRPLLPRAKGIPLEDAAADHSGIPEGYKPDTSVKYVKGKAEDGSEDQIVNADGTKTPVTGSFAPAAAPMSLPPGHTYEQRVKEQARRGGVPVVAEESNETLMFKISQMMSS